MSFPFSSAELRKIKKVQFGIWSPEEVKQNSVAHIEFPETYEAGGGTLKPKVGGLLDLRMGTSDRRFSCETCDSNSEHCPGHFGHIELAKPMFHIGFIGTVMKILRCVCFHCSKLLTDENEVRFRQSKFIKNPRNKLNFVYNICKTKTVCQADETDQQDSSTDKKGHGGCGGVQPNIKRDGLKITAEFNRKQATDESIEPKQALTAEKIHTILKRMSDQDCRALGLNPEWARPDWMILTVMPVPPPPVRPSIQMDSFTKGEDDLTHKLAEIIKYNSHLRRQEQNGAPTHIILEFASVLQYHIATYMNNEIPGQPQATQRSGRPLKSIRQRLKGKEGRIRGNLMGKRVDFSARTVITPDPNLSIDEVGVPRSIALNLTYPEIVTPFNIDRMRDLVENGPTQHPGAKFIIREDGTRLDLRYVRKKSDTHLQFGYKVERHLQDGDIILFNRQPSLHKMSMMGHRVRIQPYSTFRLNLSVTTPYNADFDGDEMNLHVPQTVETRAEILELVMSPKQVVSPQANKPVMGIVQDTLLGCRLFTKRDTFIEKDVVMNILMWLDNFDGKIPVPAILKPKKLWTGKQLFSMLIPEVNMNGFANGRPDNIEDKGHNFEISPTDTRVLIEKGDLICGIVDKRTVGNAQGSLIHIIKNEHGAEAIRQFLDGTQRIVNNWLLTHGFTVGISDTIADEATMEQINKIISSAKTEVKAIISKAQKNELEALPGSSAIDSFERSVNQVLNTARDNAGNTAQKSLHESNNIKAMVLAGSKGSYINISQIIACVGQQNVEGKRIPFNFNERTLPHFTKGDNGSESRGFVENSYLRGLTPQEFFFHSMGGREGLIDTAVKTSESGYIQRKLIKATEDIMVRYDGTVRNSLGDIIQFLYGEDSIDASFIEKQKIDCMSMNNSKLTSVYKHQPEKPDFEEGHLHYEIAYSMKNDSEVKEKLNQEYQQIVEDRNALRREIPSGEDSWPLPVNISRLIWNAQKIFQVHKQSQIDLHPVEVIKKTNDLLKDLKTKIISGFVYDDKYESQEHALTLFSRLLRSKLASKRVVNEYKLNAKAFDWLLGEIESRFVHSIVQPGEMVGAISAQSIGEPTTQMTLDTFHYAGVSSKNVTLGIPRLKEIINVAKTPKAPSLTIFLKEEYAFDSDKAKEVLCNLEHTTLAKVTAVTEIYYDPIDPENPDTIIEEDREFVKYYYEMPDIDPRMIKNLSPWLLRVELDRAMMTDKKIVDGRYQ